MTDKDPLTKQIQTILEQIHFYSTHGDAEAIARHFLKAVQNHTIADSRDLLAWCFKTFGREDTEHVVKALTAWPCPVCKKGFEQCDLCDGSGRSGPDMLCETCMGLAVIHCRFCGGSGLSALESLPSGLRLTVVGTRAKLAAKRIRVVQSELNGLSHEPKTANSKSKPSKTLLILNVLLSRLEGCLDEIKRMGPIHRRYKFLLGQIAA
ncbi:MAG: hypothetical protein AMJ65_13930 [Phycisphaerae bacterium SG8_4]|nr:MAG: hypothetical protein AMJ65_13930 [Phycisphaerae bacterium SG8_4]